VAVLALVAGVVLGAPGVASAKVPRFIFPVVGKVSYTNDFGDPRGTGSHQGNDIMAAWRAPAVAVEAGEIRIYTKSANAGCMLYLYGKSGTTYLYIHLNNDRTPNNDNKGGCKPGVSYAPGLKDGQRVRAGQMVGYVGDSGDANGIAYHLHFEVHPNDGGAVSPYRHLRRAEKLIFALPEPGQRGPESSVDLVLAGTVVAYDPNAASGDPTGGSQDGGAPPQESGGGAGGQGAPPPPPPPRAAAGRGLLTIRLATVRVAGQGVVRVTRSIVLRVPASATLERSTGKRVGWADLKPGTKLTVTTAPVGITLEAQRAAPGALQAARVVLRG
jgi:hypothetical protein